MTTWVNVAILALATWRVSSLLTNEDGPWGVFAKIRTALGENWDDNSYSYVEMKSSKWYHVALYHFAEQYTCLWCVSIWVGILWTTLYALFPVMSTWIATPFALSAAATYLNTRARYKK